MSNILKDFEAEEAKLSAEAKGALGDGVKVGAAVEAILSAAGPVLPALHLPASDVALVAAAATAISAAISWLARHGITAAKARRAAK